MGPPLVVIAAMRFGLAEVTAIIGDGAKKPLERAFGAVLTMDVS